MSIAEYILSFGIIVNAVISYFTIKNLKALKYIETITNQRIKNIDSIRNEVALIVTNIQFFIINSTSNIKNQQNDLGKPEEPEQQDSDSIVAQTDLILNGKGQIWSNSELIIHLNLLKLRVDSIQDNKNIIEKIDYFIRLFTENGNFNLNQIDDASKVLKEFLEKSQILIKSEWEKVKIETKGTFLFCPKM